MPPEPKAERRGAGGKGAPVVLPVGVPHEPGPCAALAGGVEGALARAEAGQRLSAKELALLFDEADLHGLGVAANAVRRRLNPGPDVTYIIDRNINYTNVCVYRCRFCAFYRKPGDSDAYVLPFEVIARKVEETVAAGGTGILLQGGVHHDLRLSFYEGLLHRLKESFPAVHLHAFSAPEIHFIAKADRMPVREVIARLQAAGLESVPGGGAEVLEDETRKRIWSRAKVSTSQWLDVHRQTCQRAAKWPPAVLAEGLAAWFN